MSNTKHINSPGLKDMQRPTIPTVPAIFVNATQVELQQVSATHLGLIVSNAIVSAQIPLDAVQLRQLSAKCLEFANSMTSLAVPTKPGLILP